MHVQHPVQTMRALRRRINQLCRPLRIPHRHAIAPSVDEPAQTIHTPAQGRRNSDRRLIETEGDTVLRLKERPGSRISFLRADDSGDDNPDDNPAPPAQ
jgi:hypothetical protein